MTERRVVMALAFYPRGGSAQVVRYLGRALVARDHRLHLCVGSLGSAGEPTHAATFFAGLDVHPLDFTPAVARFEAGGDPQVGPVPMHPSFEDRPGGPDPVFAALDDDAYRRQLAAWVDLLGRVEEPDVYHVHHLTHVNDAVAAVSDAPVVAHLHGTELKMLAEIEAGAPWPHAAAWRDRLRAAAARADRLVTVSDADRDLALELLPVEPGRVEVVPNGVDVERFAPRSRPVPERLAQWRRWLVDEPRGWDESGRPGSVSYTTREVERAFVDERGEARPVLLYVGRFLRFKRVPLLIRAYAALRARLGGDAPPLVVWGGHPGEWEGEHPHTVARSLGLPGVFFAGWRGHDDLSVALTCADVMVAPSVDEPFGQVYLEAMAAGLPVIATRSGGPLQFVNADPSRPTGWLVPVDDRDALAAAMETAVEHREARRQRGRHARHLVEREYSWDRIAGRVEEIYDRVLS